MTNRDLITKLNSLKNLSPDQNWLKSNRELLLTQISNSGATELSAWKILVINFQSVVKAVSHPVFALGAFVFILIAGSLFSQQTFSGTKPNDSFYIARIISEKVKLNTMFNSQERDKLAVQFASGHAQDISAVLADPRFNTEANQDQVAKLNDSFNKEVGAVKEGIIRLAATVKNQPAAKTADIVIADNSKEAQGIQLFESPDNVASAGSVIKTSAVNESMTLNEAADQKIISPAASLNATSASSTVATSTSAADNVSNTDKILDEAQQLSDEAQQLFDQKDYNKASDKLKEVDEIINK